jgi:hypothetical protein
MVATRLNGYDLVAWIQTEVQSAGPCGIWVGYTAAKGYVTAWWRTGDECWSHGHYEIETKIEAMQDAMGRAGLGGDLGRARK